MTSQPSIFCLPRLHALARSHDENFLTESLAHLLEVFLEIEPYCALTLLNQIFPDNRPLQLEALETVSIETQLSTAHGIPDIVIRADNRILFVEAKVDSGFGYDQLVRYRKNLDLKVEDHRYLVTLTRYAIEADSKLIDRSVRWYEIADTLSGMSMASEVAEYLRNEYLELLRYRCVTMEKITWELGAGTVAFANLIEMLGEAVRLRGISIQQKSGAWYYQGYIIDDGRFYVGAYLNEPNIICIETKQPLQMKSEESPEVGAFDNGKWSHRVDLSTEDAHFFARSRGSQLRFLEKWISDAIAAGQALF